MLFGFLFLVLLVLGIICVISKRYWVFMESMCIVIIVEFVVENFLGVIFGFFGGVGVV